jgi:hypothetical protein
MGPHQVGPQSQWGPIGGPICSLGVLNQEPQFRLKIVWSLLTRYLYPWYNGDLA